MSIRDYFDAEMRLLHEAAQSFAEAYPEQAGLLNLKALHDRDPTVERLLEGFAFLTGQIRQRIDDDLPEICQQFLQQCWPQMLSPLPSFTIIEFSARKQQLPKVLLLPQQTMVQSAPVGQEQTVCRFTTLAAVKLNPLSLTQVKKYEPAEGGTELKFYLQFDHPYSKATYDLKGLRLFLHADPAIALALYWALTAKVKRCDVSINQQRFNLSVSSELLSNQEASSSCHRSLQGFHLVQDYFAFREKYLFIEFQGLEKIAIPPNLQTIIITLHCQHIFPSEITLTAEQFRLHCTPAINLYTKSAEPIQLTQERYEYLLLTDVYKRDSIILQEVEKCIGFNRMTGTQYSFNAMHTFAFRENEEAFYQVKQRDGGKEFPLHYLTLAGDKNFAQYDVACELTVSNGHYPRQYLQENSITQIVDKPGYICATNLTRPTPLLKPPKRQFYLWQLMSCFSFNTRTLTELENLKACLSLFNWTAKEEQQRKINAIYHLTCSPMDKIYRGAVMRGIEMKLAVNEEGFRSPADIYLFGCMLQQFFRRYTAINFVVQTNIYCHPSQREFIWEQQCGSQPIL